MDERDLRAGNVVSLENNIYVIDSICGVNCSLYRPVDDYTDDYRDWCCEGLTPVPITEGIFDWLVFGENQFMGYPIFEKVVGECNVNIHYISNKVGCSWRVHVDNDRSERIGSVDIQYVHELQNIIRLCTGCDLEVNLSKLTKNN